MRQHVRSNVVCTAPSLINNFFATPALHEARLHCKSFNSEMPHKHLKSERKCNSLIFLFQTNPSISCDCNLASFITYTPNIYKR